MAASFYVIQSRISFFKFVLLLSQIETDSIIVVLRLKQFCKISKNTTS